MMALGLNRRCSRPVLDYDASAETTVTVARNRLRGSRRLLKQANENSVLDVSVTNAASAKLRLHN